MTGDEMMQLADALLAKYAPLLDSYPTRDEGLRFIVQGVVVDTALVVEGTFSLEQFKA